MGDFLSFGTCLFFFIPNWSSLLFKNISHWLANKFVCLHMLLRKNTNEHFDQPKRCNISCCKGLNNTECHYHSFTSFPQPPYSLKGIGLPWCLRRKEPPAIAGDTVSIPGFGRSHVPASSVHGISQARILVWVAISFSRGSY